VIRAAVPSLWIAHDAQDARRIGLQHLDNNHSDATAKDSPAWMPWDEHRPWPYACVFSCVRGFRAET
jgi:hypothetical protein